MFNLARKGKMITAIVVRGNLLSATSLSDGAPHNRFRVRNTDYAYPQ
jgi:flagella basal body P-ring formation protein FlgA